MALDHAVSVPGTSSATMAAEQLADDYEDFFHSSLPPENLDSVRAAVREFVMHHHGNSRPVVLITVRNFKTIYSIASYMHTASEVERASQSHGHLAFDYGNFIGQSN